MKCNYCQKTPKNVGLLIFKMVAITVETRSCMKKIHLGLYNVSVKKKLKIDQQILILSHKISAFSAVLGAIFIHFVDKKCHNF